MRRSFLFILLLVNSIRFGFNALCVWPSLLFVAAVVAAVVYCVVH